MTITHSSKFRLIDHYDHQDSNSVDVAKQNLAYEFSVDFADGSGSNQMQDMYTAQRTVSIGEGNEDTLDLAGGLVDRFGNTLTFATIKKLIIVNKATAAGEDLRVGGSGAATTGNLITALFGDAVGGINIKATFGFSLVGGGTGYTITGGSADVLVISNEGTGDITYDIIIGGTR